MKPGLRVLAAAGMALLAAMTATGAAWAQKSGGVLRPHALDSPPSLSMHEEVDANPARAAMGIFNNLVMFDQHAKQNSMQSVIPDLATAWSWSEEGTQLTFLLREGVTWHDGKPFTAKDVKCTWDLLTGQSSEKLRLNPRKSWYRNLKEVTINGDYEVTFHLLRPQPAFIALLASGFSVVYPCHVAPNEMRQHPIGTGPFKFVEFKPNERITLARNPNYWKPGRPYLDGVELPIIREVSTANLAFITGKLDWIATTIPLLKNVRSQAPEAICEVTAGGISRNLVINRDAPPFDNPEMRRAMALSLDRKSFIYIISEGRGDIGGAMQPLPEGVWGMPPDVQRTLPGYDPDVQKNRSEARAIMQKLGYGPDNRAGAQGVDAQHPAVSRSGGDPDRPAEGCVYRRRPRNRRDGPLVPQNVSQRLQARPQSHWRRRRRSRPAILRELCLWFAAQLHRLLQFRTRKAVRPAIG